MKRIKAACIYQTLHFQLKEDLEHSIAVRLVREEVEHYKQALERNRTRYKIVDEAEQEDGSVVIRIIKQYNRSPVGDYLIEKSLSAAQTGSFSLFCDEKSRRAMLCGFSYTIRSSVLRFPRAWRILQAGLQNPPQTGRSQAARRFKKQSDDYLDSLAALIASIIIGTTLNRSPQMP